MKITAETIKQARATAERLNLSGRELLYLDDSYIIKSCNGIGPDAWPVWLRDAVSIMYRSFAVPAMIHDLRWQQEKDAFSWDAMAERHFPAFRESNDEFFRNCLKVANSYSWFNPLRYHRRRQARTLYEMLNAFSYGHFLSTITGKTKKE